MRLGLLALASAMSIATGSAPAWAKTSEFLTKAIKGDNSEMKLGAFAASHGHSAEVRNFGAMLERDHRKAKDDAILVAARHHVAVPTAIADEARHEYARLQHLHGPAFDREFAHYMVEDHRKDIADFEQEANSQDPEDVRRLAQQTLPTLRKHLETAKAVS